MNCVLCISAESQHSNLSGSRGSSGSLNHTSVRASRTYPPQDSCYATQSPPRMNQGLNSSNHNIAMSYGVDSLPDWDTEQCDARGDDRIGCSNRQHQERSYCSIIRKEELFSESELKVKQISDCSRRPIQCPRLDCAVNVAFSALTHHFLFDHPEVPILSVDPGAKSTLIVSFASLSCGSSRCLALLLVSDKLS